MAIESLIATGIKLKGDVIFQSVIEEESGGAGTLAAVLRGYQRMERLSLNLLI